MNGTVAEWTARLRREFDDSRLLFRWNPDIERFQVGYRRPSGAADTAEWFYTLTDGNSGFRPPDGRLLRKLRTLDKKHQPNWSPERLRKFMASEKEELREKHLEDLNYEVRNELKFRKGRFWEVR